MKGSFNSYVRLNVKKIAGLLQAISLFPNVQMKKAGDLIISQQRLRQ